MSASRNKAIDKLNEEAKKPPVKKAKVKRVAVDPDSVVIPVTIAPTIQPVQPQLTQEQIDALYAQVHANDVKPEPVATISINEPIETKVEDQPLPEPKEPEHIEPEHIDKPSLIHRLKKSWIFWAVSALVIGGVIAFVVHGRKPKGDKQTEQAAKSIEVQKAQLQETEVRLNEMASIRTDSAIKRVSELMAEAVSYQKAWEATMQRMNEIQKHENELLQERIRAANDDTLRRIGSELSK